MNWEFHAVHHKRLPELINDYCYLAERGIEEWLEHGVQHIEKQPESGFSEFPRDFYHEGPSYSFRFKAYGPGGCLSPAEYDVKVEQIFYPVYDTSFKEKVRLRYIQNMESIS